MNGKNHDLEYRSQGNQSTYTKTIDIRQDLDHILYYEKRSHEKLLEPFFEIPLKSQIFIYPHPHRGHMRAPIIP